MKKLLIAAIPLILFSLSGCSSGYKDIETGRTVNAGPLVEVDHNIKIGILQPVEHPALGMARQGFVDGLKEKGFVNGKNITIDYRNAGGRDASQKTLAKALVVKNEINLGIGTGATQTLKAAEENAGKTNPLLFTAVTDPVAGKLLENNNAPEGFVTGTSDMNPVAAQIQLIKECLPNATKIGVLYTQKEVNSEVQANMAKEEAQNQGLECEIRTITSASEIKLAAQGLASSCQAIFLPTDNTIASNLAAVSSAVKSAGTLLVAGEEGMLANGAHVTLSIDYYELGKATSAMAVSLIDGSKQIKDIPVGIMTADECEYVLSTENLKASNIDIGGAMNTHTWRDIDKK